MKENLQSNSFTSLAHYVTLLEMIAPDYVSSEPAPQCLTTALEHDSLSPSPQSKDNVPLADETVTTLLNDNAQIEYVLGSLENMEDDKKIGRKHEENDFQTFPDNRSLDKRFRVPAAQAGSSSLAARLAVFGSFKVQLAGRLNSQPTCSCRDEGKTPASRAAGKPSRAAGNGYSKFGFKYLNGMEDILDDEDSMEARKLTVVKSKEELELFKALNRKSVIVNEGSHRVVVFKKEPPRAYSKPFTRFSLPCDVDGQGAWDAELDMADSFNYITEERFDQLGFVRVDYGKYERKMVKEVRMEIHGFTFLVDFVVIGYANEGEPSVLFGRDFLVIS
ncbi:hypothetical protein Tco_0140594 [Tanacetum coccineum]